MPVLLRLLSCSSILNFNSLTFYLLAIFYTNACSLHDATFSGIFRYIILIFFLFQRNFRIAWPLFFKEISINAVLNLQINFRIKKV